MAPARPTMEIKLPVWLAREKGLPRFVAVEKCERKTDKAMFLVVRHVIRASDNCWRCGLAIVSDPSKLVGYGPDCCEKMGVERPTFETAAAILASLTAQHAETTFKTWLPNYILTDDVRALPIFTEQPIFTPAVNLPPAVKAPERTAILRDGVVVLTFPYSPEVVEEVKAINGRRFDPTEKRWTIPVTAASAQGILEVLGRHEFHVEPATVAFIRKVADDIAVKICESRAEDATLDIPGLVRPLRPFQRAGVKAAVERVKVLIADEMGTGKTISAIAAVEAQDAFPCIVVCPASLKLNWRREIAMTVNRSVVILEGTKPTVPPPAAFYVINYDVAFAWASTLKALDPKAIIADESHYLKSGKARRTKAVKEMAKDINVRLLLTGTPLLNRPSELVSQLDILGRLKEFGGEWKFLRRYAEAYRDGWGHWHTDGAAHLEELNDLLRATVMIRRLKKDVLKELPPKVRSIVPMELTNRKEYAQAELDVAGYVAMLAAENAEFKASIAELPKDEQRRLTLKRMEDAAYRAKQAEVLVRVNVLRQVAARGKLEATKAWVSDFLESGEKLVLFAHHNDVVKMLASEFKAPMLYGATPNAERQKMVDRFQNDPECRLIVLNLEAGGVGLTLTAASNVAMVEFAWTPAAMQQAEDRCHRIGVAEGTESVNCWYLAAENTIDDYMLTTINDKQQVVSAATDGGSSEQATESVYADVLKKIAAKGAK